LETGFSQNGGPRYEKVFYRWVETYWNDCFGSASKQFFSNRHTEQKKFSDETLKHDQMKFVCKVNVTKTNVQEFLNTFFGYQETLTPHKYHQLRYMGYNSLYDCNRGFYILYGPLMFVNASETSPFALKAPSTDGERENMLSMKLLARDVESNTLFEKGNHLFYQISRIVHS